MFSFFISANRIFISYKTGAAKMFERPLLFPFLFSHDRSFLTPVIPYLAAAYKTIFRFFSFVAALPPSN